MAICVPDFIYIFPTEIHSDGGEQQRLTNILTGPELNRKIFKILIPHRNRQTYSDMIIKILFSTGGYNLVHLQIAILLCTKDNYGWGRVFAKAWSISDP